MLSMYISVHFFTIQHTLYSFHMAYFLLVCVVSKSMNYATIGASYTMPLFCPTTALQYGTMVHVL